MTTHHVHDSNGNLLDISTWSVEELVDEACNTSAYLHDFDGRYRDPEHMEEIRTSRLDLVVLKSRIKELTH